MQQEPKWLATISSNAMITKDEVCGWLRIPAQDFRKLVDKQGFPPPRINKHMKRWTNKVRWRVGDIRLWLIDSAKLEQELSKPIGDPLAKNFKNLAFHRNQ